MELKPYKTVAAYAECEFIERKSRFIGSVMPCSSEGEALAFIEQKKKQHWDASHNVSAYILRDGGIKRCSDDGEPQGTAGRPVLDVLEKQGLTDLCVVATRYFGGIMLGAGGLVRAYSHTAKIALDDAVIKNMCVCRRWKLSFDYSYYGKLGYILPDYPHIVEKTDFGEQVEMSLLIREDGETGLRKALTELSGGTLCPDILETCYADIP